MEHVDHRERDRLRLTGTAAAGALLLPLIGQLRLARPTRAASERWQTMAVHPRGHTRLGISFRTPQVAAFGLDPERRCGSSWGIRLS